MDKDLQAVWFFSTSGPKQTYNPDHGTWVPFYKEHNVKVEEAFNLGTESNIVLKHPDGKFFLRQCHGALGGIYPPTKWARWHLSHAQDHALLGSKVDASSGMRIREEGRQ